MRLAISNHVHHGLSLGRPPQTTESLCSNTHLFPYPSCELASNRVFVSNPGHFLIDSTFRRCFSCSDKSLCSNSRVFSSPVRTCKRPSCLSQRHGHFPYRLDCSQVLLILDCTDYPGTPLDEQVSKTTLQFWYEFAQCLVDCRDNDDPKAVCGVWDGGQCVYVCA